MFKDQSADERRDLRHDRVAEPAEPRRMVRTLRRQAGRQSPTSVQPGGKPISHSTHSGFSLVGRIAPPVAPVADVGAAGVGESSGDVSGEQASATAHPSLFGVPRPSCEHRSVTSFDAFAEFGVGQGREDEDAVPEMRGANVGSVNAVPFRIVPERGQRPEYGVQPPNKKR